jgi:UDP-N-acetylglucosamine 2-epimerase (non-hydrolysing)
MKIMTILGTRPEIIRLSRVIEKLDRYCTHVLVHTGQNFDKNLSDIFFQDLKIRKPDYFLGVRGATSGEQIAQILTGTEKILKKERPDRLLILGDTNSGLSAIIAKRMGIPVVHMEAGNRCFDDRVPEEVNRRIIDHCSDLLLPYTERSRDHLLHEGFHHSRILVTGNPIREVLDYYLPEIDESDICKRLAVGPGKYFLVTLHRAENVDNPERLAGFMKSLSAIHQKYHLPVLLSLHPRTRSRLGTGRKLASPGIHFFEPLGFFDFVMLERNAMAILSDSGTVQEEGCILGIPAVTLRDVTERPETIECGSNILSGGGTEDILRCLEVILDGTGDWTVPGEYQEKHVSRTVCNILLGYRI